MARRRASRSADARGRRCRRSTRISADLSRRRLQPAARRRSTFTAQAGRAVGDRRHRRAARSTRSTRVAVSVDWTRAPVGEQTVADHVHGAERLPLGRAAPSSAIRRRRSVTRSSGSSRATATCRWKPSTYGKAVGSANGTISWLTHSRSRQDAVRRDGDARDGARRRRPAAVAPHLEYPVFLFDSGAVKVNVLRVADAQLLGIEGRACATPCRSTIRRRRS